MLAFKSHPSHDGGGPSHFTFFPLSNALEIASFPAVPPKSPWYQDSTAPLPRELDTYDYIQISGPENVGAM